ncbi:hypothetical protein M900_2586 [Bacteriovorax sp. Seq25_V]|nr:hypothetical protein M900_2586 [Bacteriovorax sp. Seq25_V]
MYNSYAHSIIEDGNLNISDELYEIRKYRKEPIIQTPTNYDPDYHSHGSSFVFAPFIIIGKLFSDISRSLSGDISQYLKAPWPLTETRYLEDMFIGVGLFMFALIGFYQLWSFCFRESTNRDKVISMALLMWATPFYMYTIHYPGNMNIVLLPLLTLLYKFLYDREFTLNERELVYFVSLLSIGFIIKVDIAFVAVFLPIVFWRSRGNLTPKDYVGPSFVVLLVLILFLVNRYLQYGSLHLGYGGVTSSFIPLTMLFTPFSGLLYTCPIFIFLLIFYFSTKTKDRNLTILLLSPLAKFIAISFAFNSGVDFGWRDVIGNLYIWALVLAHIFKNHKFKRGFLLISVICMLWTMFLSAYYNHLPFGESYSFYLNVFAEGISFLPNYFFLSVQAFHFSWLRLILFILLLCFLCIISRNREFIGRYLPHFFIISYLIVTCLNYINRDNIIIYDDAIVTDDIKTWYLIENK